MKVRNDTIVKKKKANAEQKRIDEEHEAKHIADEVAKAKQIVDEAIEAKRVADEAVEAKQVTDEVAKAKWVADEATEARRIADEVKRIADEKAAVDKVKLVAGLLGVTRKGAQAREGDREVVHLVSASGSLPIRVLILHSK